MNVCGLSAKPTIIWDFFINDAIVWGAYRLLLYELLLNIYTMIQQYVRSDSVDIFFERLMMISVAAFDSRVGGGHSCHYEAYC